MRLAMRDTAIRPPDGDGPADDSDDEHGTEHKYPIPVWPAREKRDDKETEREQGAQRAP